MAFLGWCYNFWVMAIINEIDSNTGLFKMMGLSARIFSDNFSKLVSIYLPYLVILLVSQSLGKSGFAGLLSFLVIVLSFLAHTAAVYFVVKEINGEDLMIGEAWSFVKQHWLKIILTMIIYFLFVIGLWVLTCSGLIAAAIVSKLAPNPILIFVLIALGFVALIYGLWQITVFFVKTVFISAVMVDQERFYRDALDASTELTKPNFGKAFTYSFFYLLLLALLLFIPMMIISSSIGVDKLSKISFVSEVGLLPVLSFDLISILAGMFMTCFSTAYYFKFKSM